MWQWKGDKPVDLSQFNQKAADALIGKRVLIGKTYQKPDGTVVKRTQQYGAVVEVHRTNGVAIKLHNSGEIVWLPPDVSSWRHAPPGVYTLESTGEEVQDPDYLTTWIVETK